MTKILSGKDVTNQIDIRNRTNIMKLHEIGITPRLAIIRIGEQGADVYYEKNIIKKCQKLGVAYEIFSLPPTIDENALLNVIAQVNANPNIHGVLLFRPLPKHLNEQKIINMINPEKDVDGITDYSIAGVFTGKDQGFSPCTPQSCIKLLDYYDISCAGKKIVVVGRSLVVGKPITMMLLHKNATVTVCHTKTQNMTSIIKNADIVIVAAGKTNLINSSCVKNRQIIIDVGININEEGRILGDVDYEDIKDIVDAITPVPGGVGTITTSVLIEHVVKAALKKHL